MPLVIVGGILVAAYLVGKAMRPKPTLSIDAQEALAPAPFSTEGGASDNLTPTDLQNPWETLDLDIPATDGSGANILWDWTSGGKPTDPGRKFHDPRRKPKHYRKGVPEQMRLGCANIKNFPDMSPEKVRADGKTVGSHCTLWGGQEINPGEDAPVVLKGLESNNAPWAAVLTQFAEPIFYRTDLWEPFDEFFIREEHPLSLPGPHGLHDAITSAGFRSLKHPDLAPFAVVNCHLINGA